MTPKRVTVQVGFMSPAECVRRIKAASQKEAEAMLHTLEDEARRAALRERDAAHEIALRTARADALNAAAALFDKKDAEARAETYFVTQPGGDVREEHPSGHYMSAREAASAIRALLEEAGK